MATSSGVHLLPPSSGPATGPPPGAPVFVFDESQAADANRYDDWDLLLADAQQVYGPKLIQFIDDFTLPAQVNDVAGAMLAGPPGSSPSAGTAKTLTCPEGATITNLGVDAVKDGLILYSTATTHPIIEVDGTGRSFYFYDDALVASKAYEFFEVSATSGLVNFSFRNGAGIVKPSDLGIMTGDYESINVTGTPTLCFTSEPYGYSNIQNNVLRSSAAQGMYRFVFTVGAALGNGATQANLGGGYTLFRQTSGYAVGYTPAVGADWTDPDPDNIRDAVDRLAAAVSGLLAGPIP